MAIPILFFLFILSMAQSSPTLPTPKEVYEEVKEENVRVPRHPKFHQEPPKFDYKQMVQQDPQKIRYAQQQQQQQQMDSYIRAYQQEHILRHQSKTAYDTRTKSHSRPKSENSFPEEKKVDDTKTKKSGYRVNEDLDAEASIRQPKLVLGSLSANYLAKQPTYVLANPQLNIDPNLLMEGLKYQLPEGHQFAAEGFQPASKNDIEALSSLLGKNPNVQLQGLNELLGQQSTYPTAPQVSQVPQVQQVPQIPQIPIKEVTIEPEALLGLHNPIKEVDINSHSHTHITHEVLPETKKYILSPEIPETKSYEQHDNLQYAAQYAFGYKIRDYHSGSNFGHEEVREGDVAKGHYHVLLPDGRLQNVEYWADPSGYHATVTYSKVAEH